MDRRFTRSQALLWTYTFVFIVLKKMSVNMCLWLDYLYVMLNDSLSYRRWSQTFESDCCPNGCTACSVLCFANMCFMHNGFLRTLQCITIHQASSLTVAFMFFMAINLL